MVAIIPLLIILVVVILLGMRRSGFSLRHNIQIWLTAGYILLLLVSPAIVGILPEGKFADAKMKTVSKKELFNQEDLYTLALEARPEQTEGVFVLEQWEFPYDGSMINVVERPEHEYSAAIIVERNDSADGKIEAVDYATKTIVEMIDFSERMKPHRVALDGNVLKVTAPERLDVELGKFSREFVVSQILGDAMPESDPFGHFTIHGSQLLYLRVPAGLEVQSEAAIQFVEK